MAPAAEGAATDMAAPAGEPVPEGLSDDDERAGGDKVSPMREVGGDKVKPN
jgi:hypothetical protein